MFIKFTVGSSGKDDSCPGTHLILSACPNALLTKISSEVVHRYWSDSNIFKIRTVFEVRVRSQSICGLDADTTTGGGGEGGEPSALAAQIWSTKEAGACVLTALLLRLEPDESKSN